MKEKSRPVSSEFPVAPHEACLTADNLFLQSKRKADYMVSFCFKLLCQPRKNVIQTVSNCSVTGLLKFIMQLHLPGIPVYRVKGLNRRPLGIQRHTLFHLLVWPAGTQNIFPAFPPFISKRSHLRLVQITGIPCFSYFLSRIRRRPRPGHRYCCPGTFIICHNDRRRQPLLHIGMFPRLSRRIPAGRNAIS